MSRFLNRTALSVFGLGAAASVAMCLPAYAGGETGNTPAANHPASGNTSQGWILHERVLNVPDSEVVIRTWDQINELGEQVPCYAISKDGGKTWTRDRQTSYDLLLRYAKFDPLVRIPAIHPALQAGDQNDVYIVQFLTPPVDEFRRDIIACGGTIRKFIGNHAYVVELDDEARGRVENLNYVRWVGAFQPAYKIEEWILNEYFPMGYDAAGPGVGLQGADNPVDGPQDILAANGAGDPAVNNDESLTFNVMVFERGPRQKRIVARKIRELGGRIENLIDEGFILRATFNVRKLASLLQMNEVAFVDLWGPPEEDMDIAREIGGANFIETFLGYTGQGVHVEVMDGGILDTHTDFQNPPVTIHGPRDNDNSHGTSTCGIVYGDGTTNPMGRGMLPDAEMKIFADYSFLTNRYTHTAELTDPDGQYRAVLQSNSWGDPRTRDYTTVSSEMDDLLFQNDIIICQSQSNAGNQDSRPQAWAKNIVSVGGVNHRNTLTKDDDCWCFSASIGPAKDGRIKPDLTHFYDDIFTTSSSCNSCYTSGFGGTSGATPIVAGHIGLIFQMWHEGTFPGFGGGNSVFDDKPHMSTAKALVINSADQYPFDSPGDDLSRVKQGWGMPQLETLYENRNDMLIVDESDVLENLESKSYNYTIPDGKSQLKVTLVYTDPMGVPFSQRHRINDLSLKVTSPGGTVYWGNNGLLDGNYSTSGGSSNVIDTVENVFVQAPAGGDWTIEVFADEIVEDSHIETGTVDADYALVASYSQDVAPSCMDLVVSNLVAGEIATFTVSKNLIRGQTVAIVYGFGGDPTELNNFAGYCATFGFNIPGNSAAKRVVAEGFVNQNNEFVVQKKIPANLSGLDIMFQAAKKGTCPEECMSQIWEDQIQ